MQWTVGGLIRLAATSIGRRAYNPGGLGESRGTLAALSSLAYICTDSLNKQVAEVFGKWGNMGDSLWVFARHRDATSIKVHSGKMRRQMSPLARYPLRGADGNRPRHSADAYKQLASRALLAFGVVELFGQTATICHTHFRDHGQNCWTIRDVILPPKALASGHASCVFSAAASVPNISIADVNALSKALTIYIERPDGAKSNKKAISHRGQVGTQRVVQQGGLHGPWCPTDHQSLHQRGQLCW